MEKEKDIADVYYDIIVEKASEEENKKKGSFIYWIPEDVLNKIVPILIEKDIIKGVDSKSSLSRDYRNRKMAACVLYLVEKSKLKKERKDEIVRTLEELIQLVKESEEIWTKPHVIG